MSRTTRRRGSLGVALAVMLVTGALSPAEEGRAQAAAPAGSPVRFTDEFLRDQRNIDKGRELFQSRCKFCHGKTAYPGKAPKLEPFRYTPEFVYDRVTNGFRGMPSWAHEFDEEQRKQIVAYVMSPEF